MSEPSPSWMKLRGPMWAMDVCGHELLILTEYGIDIKGLTIEEIAPEIVDRILDADTDTPRYSWAHGALCDWARPILVDWMDPDKVVCDGYSDKPLYEFTRQDWIDLMICFIGSDEEILELLRKVFV